MKAVQTALEMYYADNGEYPGNAHYINNSGTGCLVSGQSWESVFNTNFRTYYLSVLPQDPLGKCYLYTRASGSALLCNGESVSTFQYVLIFRSENTINNPLFKVVTVGESNWYCLAGEKR